MKKWLYVVAAACLAACGGSSVNVESNELVGSDEKGGFSATELPARARLSVGAPVNLRAAASREAADAEVTLLRGTPEQGFYKVSYQEREGWAYGAHLRQLEAAEFAQSTSALTTLEGDAIMTRVSGAIGYSYWWGHARWGCGLASGYCSGTSYSGTAGTDAPGLISKSWHVPPSADPSTCVDYHPYTTSMFYNNRPYWTAVSRGAMQKADALSNSSHIFMYVSGDGWGTMEVYECSGCSTGCARRYRTAASDYIALRRNTGWL